MGTVKLDFSTNDSEAQKKFDALNAKLDAMQQKGPAAGHGIAEGAKVAAPGLESLVSKASAISMALTAIAGAAKVARSEFEALKKFQDASAQSQTSAANAEAKLIRNLGAQPRDQRNAFLSEMQNISAQTGVSLTSVLNAASFATSAAGSNDNKTVADAIRTAAQIAPDDPMEMQATAAGLLDISSVTGSADAGRNAGYMLALGAQTRVTDLQKINQNLVPGAIGVKGFGGSAEEAGALVSTMTSAMKDPTGAVSKTAGINLAAELEKMFPDLGDSPIENIRKVQNDPKLRDKFLREANIAAEALTPVKDMLTAGTDTAKLLEENIKKFPGADEAGAMTKQFLADSQGTVLQQQAALQRRYQQGLEQIELANFIAGRSSIQREGALETTDAADPGFVKGKLRRFVFSMPGRTTDDAAENAIQSAMLKAMVDAQNGVVGGKETLDALQRIHDAQKETNQNLAAIRGNQRTSEPNQHVEGR